MPPWCRKSPKVSEVLPLLYLHGLSTGDFGPALSEFFGSAAGLSGSVVCRLTKSWQDGVSPDRVHETVDRLLMSRVDSWFHGVNSNLPHKLRTPMIYAGGLPTYRERCDDVVARGYAGFTID